MGIENATSGLAGLRKLAGDVRGKVRIWQLVGYEAEEDWCPDERVACSLRDTLERLADEIEAERPAVTDAERRVLEMWPRFEDGEPVMPGDEFIDYTTLNKTVKSVVVYGGFVRLHTEGGNWIDCNIGERVKRAPEVLDADGVPIKVGDTVWIIPECSDTPDEPHEVACIDKWGEVLLEFHLERSTGLKGEYLTHTRPDSWERIESDLNDLHGTPLSVVEARLLVARCKKLAGVES